MYNDDIHTWGGRSKGTRHGITGIVKNAFNRIPAGETMKSVARQYDTSLENLVERAQEMSPRTATRVKYNKHFLDEPQGIVS